MSKTLAQNDHILHICKNIFLQKANEYGGSWRFLHPSTRFDQIYIKPSRIQYIEEQNQPLIDEKPDIEYLGLMKYSNMDLVQLRKIENNKLKTLISEGINAKNLVIVIYAIFALVNWSETQPWSLKIN
ncbi:MAG: DUF1599 domain-containing protein [Saprospiraceae bacterium]|uniref:DUF1599 domain-containing protein n=1 Tax=Candidatus Defluviibacterium haderslevense TaxID=2981993 RepID=A0A9D7SDC1_9BACT|nr:DUF1599 domain-containing protein [Candidatus Defluviibacterium haderslevense]